MCKSVYDNKQLKHYTLYKMQSTASSIAINLSSSPLQWKSAIYIA